MKVKTRIKYEESYLPPRCRKLRYRECEEFIDVNYANLVAEKRGDTKDIGKFKPFIICHMPELVKIKPNKWHDGE